MRVRKSNLRRSAEGLPEERKRGPGTALGALARQVLSGSGVRRTLGTELEDLPLPDLLTARPDASPDAEPLINLLDLAFLGRASAGEMDVNVDALPPGESPFVAAHFASDLFLGELVASCLPVRVPGTRFAAHRRFLQRVLESTPTDLPTIRFRQGILRELDENPTLADSLDELIQRIADLLSLLRASRDDARLQPVRFRLDVLESFRAAVVHMHDGFEGASSGLHRLSECGARIRDSQAFGRMEALLDHHAAMANLRLEVRLGADGRLRHLEVHGITERRRNPFYRGPLRRWWDRARLVSRSYRIERDELVDRLVMGVYQDVAPAMARVVQAVCHLEVYVAARAFAAEAARRGLAVCLPTVEPDCTLQVEAMFNPLLLQLMERPVPSDLDMTSPTRVILVTGPNSGGKTRLLQAIGLTQILGQAGLYVPCRRARLPLVTGMFASIVEVDRADQAEGRLGTELVRLRTLFETAPPGSLVLLDELCSGTNPSEALEIVDMVLRLLRRLDPAAFVTTHFLDFAQQLYADAPTDGLGFLQAEVDPERGATFRFIPGVATTSLAVGTARRLGVTFEELERKLERRVAGLPPKTPHEP